jgi:hypothetical protein
VDSKPSTKPLELEEEVEVEGTETTKLPKSRDEFVRRVSDLKGNARLTFYGGFGLLVIGAIWFLVRGFQVSIWWGLALFFCNATLVVPLLFLVLHWSKAKDPLFVKLLGVALMMVALVVLS